MLDKREILEKVKGIILLKGKPGGARQGHHAAAVCATRTEHVKVGASCIRPRQGRALWLAYRLRQGTQLE